MLPMVFAFYYIKKSGKFLKEEFKPKGFWSSPEKHMPVSFRNTKCFDNRGPQLLKDAQSFIRFGSTLLLWFGECEKRRVVRMDSVLQL